MGSFGGGGFSPSRANIGSSTIVGAAASDTHQVTGSMYVDPLLSASVGQFGSITALSHTVSGDLVVTGSLYVSSSATGNEVPLFRVDHQGSTGDNPILFVTGSGRVGIGTDDPDAELEVVGSATFRASPDGTNTFQILDNDGGAPMFFVDSENERVAINWPGEPPTAGFHVYGEETQKLAYRPSSAVGPVLKFESGGVTIGSSATIVSRIEFVDPNEVVAGRISYKQINTDSSRDQMIFQVGLPDTTLPALFLSGSGCVGINTAAPTKALTVVGDISASLGLSGFSITYGGTEVLSTATELNLLDATTTNPSDGAWALTERVAKATIDGADWSIGVHDLGITIPDNAIVTKSILDITTGFSSLDPNQTTVAVSTADGAIFAAVGPISALGYTSISIQNAATFGFTAFKQSAARTLNFTVATEALTAGVADVYIYYIIGA